MLGLFYCCFFFNTWCDRLKRQKQLYDSGNKKNEGTNKYNRKN